MKGGWLNKLQQAKILLKLQEYLLKKLELKKDSQFIGLAKELNELKMTIAKAEQENIELSELAKNKEKKARELEQQLSINSEQIKLSKERLYNAKGSGLRELLSLQQAIQKLEEDIESGEADYLRLLNEAEECREKRINNREIIKGLKTQYNQGVRKYNELRKTLELKLAELIFQEEETISQLNQEYLTTYQKIVKKFPSNPVAVLKGDTCSICHISISAILKKDVKQGKKVCFCENCGRILVSSK